MAVHTPMLNMPWNDSLAEERRFRIIVAVCLIIALVIAVAMPLIKVPEIKREEAEKLPPRLAKLILERKKIEPPKIELPKVEEKKPEPESEPEPEPEKKPEPEPEPKPEPKPKPDKKVEPPKKVDIEAARRKAASSGVLAMQDMLADLRDAQPVSSITSKKPLQTSGTTERKQARSLLLANAEKGSGGINTSNFSRDTGSSELAGRKTVEVTSSIEALEAVEETGSGSAGGAPGGRSLDEITRVMNANKNAVFNIYQRALRKNPLLRGTVVFKLTIAPDGTMTACEIISSDLNDKRLERKLVLRVKRINFGAKNVEEITVNFPIEFLPP